MKMTCRTWPGRAGRSAWLALGIALLLSACAGSQSDPSASAAKFNWRQFQGTKLRVLLNQSPWQAAIMGYVPEFEALTGIQTRVEVYAQNDLWNTLNVDLNEPGRVDVFAVVPNLDGLHYLSKGQIQPVNAFLRDASMTVADYQWEDFFPRFRAAMEVRGSILGPPVMAEYLALLYRKDVLSKYKLAVPRTLEEVEAAARLLHKQPMNPKGEPGVGIVSRGQGPVSTALYASLLHDMGGTWLDGGGQPTMNSPQSLAALGWISRLLGRYAPPDVSKFNWPEAVALFLEGRAAMYIEGSSIYPLIENSNSRIAEQVGYAPFPSGPGGNGGTVAVRGLAIAKQSFNPGAAWLFMQWAGGPEITRKALMHGVLVARESTWKDRVARSEVPPDLAEGLQQAGRTGVIDWLPPMVEVTAAREVVGHVITAAIQGQDLRTAAEAAERQLREIWAKTEKR